LRGGDGGTPVGAAQGFAELPRQEIRCGCLATVGRKNGEIRYSRRKPISPAVKSLKSKNNFGRQCAAAKAGATLKSHAATDCADRLLHCNLRAGSSVA